MNTATNFKFEIHPGNETLFPNVNGIWQHYQQYAIDKCDIKVTPQVSQYASGTNAVGVLT